LDFSFASKALRRICEESAWAQKQLGDVVASSLQRRLADLEACENLSEPPPWVSIEFGESGDAAIEFHPGYWLNIVAIRGALPMNGNQKVDWTIVDRIKLMGIQTP
jgi:hypothetical protein